MKSSLYYLFLNLTICLCLTRKRYFFLQDVVSKIYLSRNHQTVVRKLQFCKYKVQQFSQYRRLSCTSERIILRLGRQMLVLFLSLLLHEFMYFRVKGSLYVIIWVKKLCKSKRFCKSKAGRKRWKCIKLRKGDYRKI